MSVDQALGATVVALTRWAAERWAAGDLAGAERLAAGAFRLVEGGAFVDVDCPDCPEGDGP